LMWQNAADGFAVVASRMGPMLDWINSKFDSKPAIQGMRALRAEADAQEKSMAALESQWAKKQKRIVDLAKEAADAIADIDNAHRSAFEQFQNRGEDLRRSLMTPIEAFRESMDEFNELLRLRMIDSETFARAAAKARDELGAANRSKFIDQARQPIAAVERYTMAGYSASLSTQRDDKREEKQAVNLLGGIKDVMQHIDAQLGNRPDWPQFQMSRLQ
jgi:gas vesicle protein